MQTRPTARFVMVPGFWLGAWAWDRVAEPMRAAGHRLEALTLPGLASRHEDRRAVRLADHVAAVVAALRAGDEPAVLVAHSGAGPVAYAAGDRAPELVERIIYVDSGPLPDGVALNGSLSADIVEVELPSWEDLARNDASIEGLSGEDLAHFRDRSVPEPAAAMRDSVSLHNPARYDIPATLISCSFRPEQVRTMMAEGHPFFAELARFDVTIRDLPTGHWPMWSSPVEPARLLSSAISGPAA